MNAPDLQRLHRASRIVLEQGAERDVLKAEDHLRRLRVQLVVGRSTVDSGALQAGLLTAVNAGARTFLGGVYVVGAQAVPTRTPLGRSASLADDVRALGGRLLEQPRTDVATIVVGNDVEWPVRALPAVRIQVQDWKAAVLPAHDPPILSDESPLPLTGVFAAAIALSEIFSAQMNLHPEAGRRAVGFSLWQPGPARDWQRAPTGPTPTYLPGELSVIGLGHLGQAYLWALASLPYSRPKEVEIVLQDRDLVGHANLSTGALMAPASIGKPKVRVVSQCMEERGFRTRMIERRFTEQDRFSEEDPHLVLVGVDSPQARVQLATAAHEIGSAVQLLDVGLGAGPLDFDEMVLHSSPFAPSELQRWRTAKERQESRVATLAREPRMQEIASASGLDRCGILRLADQAVGVPFVGAAAGALVLAEVLRRLAGAPAIRTMGLRLRDLALSTSPVIHAAPPSFITFVRCDG